MTRDGMNRLHVVCNGCGELMRQMGEWPTQFPNKLETGKYTYGTQQSFRYSCKTCRLPNEHYKNGVSMMVSILDVPEQTEYLPADIVVK